MIGQVAKAGRQRGVTLFGLLFWAVIILAGVALIRHLTAGNRTVEFRTRPTPEQLLAERFARGEIDEQEYHQRLDMLTYRPRVEP